MSSLVGVTPERSQPKQPPALHWKVLAATGLAITLVGCVDILLLWYPPAFGAPDWEFGTVSSTMDALPLVTIGAAVVAASSIAIGLRRVARSLALWCWIVVIALSSAFVLYLLTVPVALQSGDGAMQFAIRKSIAKTSLFAAIYVVLYVWLGWYLWRHTRPVCR